MEIEVLKNQIKDAFCSLTKFKLRGNVLEIITAYSTINNKLVSVFVKFENNKFVVTDAGWIDSNIYDTPLFEESEDLIKRITFSYLENYRVKITHDATGKIFYYKTTDNYLLVPGLIFDLANFSVGVINSFCLQFKDVKEEQERETFRKDANNFLKLNYGKEVKLNSSLDDYKNIKFNAIVARSSNLYLITYITGSTPYYFNSDLRKSIVNFELSERSIFKPHIKEKITIINNECHGFNPNIANPIISLLTEKTTRDPIMWKDKNQLLSIL